MGCCGSKQDWEPVVSLEDTQKEFISAKLRQNASFQELYDLSIDDLIPTMTMRSYYKGSIIFKKGDPSDALYFILRGQCQVIQFDKRMGLLSKGSVVGEMGMIHGVKRTFSLQAFSDDCIIIKIMKEGYDKLTNEHNKRKESLNYKLLSRATIFHDIPMKFYITLENIAKEINFREGQMILTKDTKNEYIYIIKSGSVNEEVLEANTLELNETITTLGQFSCFGEEAILNELVVTNIIANEYTSTLVFDVKLLKQQLPDDLINQIINNAKQKKKLYKRLKSFSELSVLSTGRKRSNSQASNYTANNENLESSSQFSDNQSPSSVTTNKQLDNKKKSFTKDSGSLTRDFSFKDIPVVDESNSSLNNKPKRKNSTKLKRSNSNRSMNNLNEIIESKSVDYDQINRIIVNDDTDEMCTTIMCCMQQPIKKKNKNKRYVSKLE